MKEVGPKLDEWVGRGLITTEQADAIRAAEADTQRSTRGRVSLAGEALGYFGGALLVGAFLVGFGGIWEDLGIPGRVAILGLTTALLVFGGAALRRSEEPAVERLAGFLWITGAGTWGGLAFVLSEHVLGFDDETTAGVFTGVATAAFAYPLWRLRCKALQQIAVFTGALLALFSVGFSDLGVNGETLAGVLVAVLGAGWLVASQVGRIAPRRTGEALGSIAMLVGVQTAGFDEAIWLLGAIVVAVAILTLGVVRDRNIPLGLGATGLFIFVPQFITEAFGSSVGAAGSIAIAGILIIGAAVFLGRRRQRH